MTTEVQLSYRPAQAAKVLGVSRETVYDLFAKGELKGFKIGSARLISSAELERFIRQREADQA